MIRKEIIVNIAVDVTILDIGEDVVELVVCLGGSEEMGAVDLIDRLRREDMKRASEVEDFFL